MGANILFLYSGMTMPTQTNMQEKFNWLSKAFKGSIIAPVGEVQKYREIKNIHKFHLYLYLYYQGNFLIRNLRAILSMCYTAFKIYYSRRKFNIIVSPNPLITGLVALLVAKITSAKVIIEINGNFSYVFKYGVKDKQTVLAEKIKNGMTKYLIKFVIDRADGIKLLYKTQLNDLYGENNAKIVSCFHDFTPTGRFKPNMNDMKYILFLGYPWFLKGVDVLIQSFNKIYKDYPGYKLKIFGWCPEGKDYFQGLVKNNANIELCNPVYYNDVVDLVNQCTLLVLPSRTEAMGRCLLEAMAARKAVIASNVDGIPTYVIDGYNGLLFESENIDDLADKLRILLDDEGYRNQLAGNGYRYVHENLSEQCYINKYKEFVEDVLTK